MESDRVPQGRDNSDEGGRDAGTEEEEGRTLGNQYGSNAHFIVKEVFDCPVTSEISLPSYSKFCVTGQIRAIFFFSP